MEAAYIGRLGRRLLQQLDLAEPLDLVDPVSGMDYFRAGTLLSQDVDRNNGYADPDTASQATVDPIPYFENLFPYLATGGMSATQNIYSNEWAFERGNETTALSDIDVFCTLGCGPIHHAALLPAPVLLTVCLVQRRRIQLQRRTIHSAPRHEPRPAIRFHLYALEFHRFGLGHRTHR